MKLDGFDYACPAELYTVGGRRGGRRAMAYRRFETAANAIRYTIESLSGSSLYGTAMEVDGQRYDHALIRKLYNSQSYPLPRRTGADDGAPQAGLST